MLAEIKIFVSHRIDIESEIVNNNLYVPVRCGAVFDKTNPMKIQGDDTGEHISERRMSFCEFTVQYWAWKNEDADYYGLCHYRRYLCFAERHFKTDAYNMIYEPILTKNAEKRYGLLDKEKISELVLNHDVIVSEYADVKQIPTPKGKKSTVYEHWKAHEGIFFEKGMLELLLKVIDERWPAFSISAREYLSGDQHRGFNCFILKKELFFQMCEMQFDIMFEIEKKIDSTEYTQTMQRTPAFLGEIVYGIYIYHISKFGTYRVKEQQLVFFSRTEKLNGFLGTIRCYSMLYLDKVVRFLVDPIFPKGSQRREILKNIFYTIFPVKKRGMANPKI